MLCNSILNRNSGLVFLSKQLLFVVGLFYRVEAGRNNRIGTAAYCDWSLFVFCKRSCIIIIKKYIVWNGIHYLPRTTTDMY